MLPSERGQRQVFGRFDRNPNGFIQFGASLETPTDSTNVEQAGFQNMVRFICRRAPEIT